MRRLLGAGLTALVAALALDPVAGPSGAGAQVFEPQLKINHIDTSKAPLIRVFASVLAARTRPVDPKLIGEVALFRKPEGESAEKLFSFEGGELKWPKDLDEEAIKKKEKEEGKPELAFAADLKDGAAVVVIAPGFQDIEYRAGALGAVSKSAAALFLKKLGSANLLNVIWYNDYVHTYVYKDGYTNGLTVLTPELVGEARKWETKSLEFWGLTEEEAAEARGEEPGAAPKGPRKGEVRYGLHADYSQFPGYVAKQGYEGYWPQLFGIGQVTEPCQTPEFPIKRMTMGGEEGQRIQALDLALEILTRDALPGQPRILIITGDGRDGYINQLEECRFRFETECDAQDDVKRAAARAARGDWSDRKRANEIRKKCIDGKKQARANQMIAAEQAVFARKLPVWIGLAKAANIRIYTVIHPTAQPYTRERLELLAWRTGGTPRYAADANEVSVMSDALAEELNGQIVLTFMDTTVDPKEDVTYQVEVKAGRSTFRSDTFKVLAPPRFEPGLIASVKAFGEGKLGKGGFLAAVIVVGLLVLVILLKILGKIFKSGEAAAKKASKGGKGAEKAKKKAIERAKKMKDAQKKAAAKAKGG